MKKLIKAAKNNASKALLAAGTFGTSLAYAVDDAAVTAAQDAGSASVLNASNGLLAIIAIIVGISLVLSLMKKA